jgi:hypothetical protein
MVKRPINKISIGGVNARIEAIFFSAAAQPKFFSDDIGTSALGICTTYNWFVDQKYEIVDAMWL